MKFEVGDRVYAMGMEDLPGTVIRIVSRLTLDILWDHSPYPTLWASLYIYHLGDLDDQ